MKFQSTTRSWLLATAWIAVGVACLLQMKTTDVVQTISFDSLPNTDDAAIRAYQQISTESVGVTRRGLQLTIKFARPTFHPFSADDIDWQSLGYGRCTGGHWHEEVRTSSVFWYLIAAVAWSLLASAWRRWPPSRPASAAIDGKQRDGRGAAESSL